MALAYLTGSEQLTAERLNLLFAELDRKLSLALSGKIFLLAGIPDTSILLGRCRYWFTSGDTAYSHLYGMPLKPGEPYEGISYDHGVFERAANVVSLGALDSAKFIADCSDPAASYHTEAGLPYPTGVTRSFFDASLEAHTRVPLGSSVPHYLRVTGWPYPERRYKQAMAEVFIEGPTSITIRSTWNKFNAFRFHNFNHVAASVSFEGGPTYNIAALGSVCVRRDYTTGSHTQGYNYLQKAMPGDPRWFSQHISAAGSLGLLSPSFAMWPNNAANPFIILNYIGQLQQSIYARLELDPGEVCDIKTLYSDLLADPDNADSKLGDMLHHPGKLIVARKTGASWTFTNVQFRGYDTAQADLARAGVTWAENAETGVVTIEAANPSVETDIISIGTNLLCDRGTLRPVVNVNNPVVIEPNLQLHSVPTTVDDNEFRPFRILSVPVSSSYRVASQHDYFGNPTGFTDQTIDATRSEIESAIIGDPAVLKLAQVNAGLLLNLSHVSEHSGNDPDSSVATFADRDLTLTPTGLVITTTTNVPIIGHFEEYNLSNWIPSGTTARLTRRFELGHFGFPKPALQLGSNDGVYRANVAFLSPRRARYYGGLGASFVPDDIKQEDTGLSGSDFELQSIHERTQTSEVAILHKLGTQVGPKENGRFPWFANPDGLAGFLQNYQRPGWYESNRGRLLAGILGDYSIDGEPGYFLRVPTYSEYFNLLAQAINSIKKSTADLWKGLRWYVPSMDQVISIPENNLGINSTSIRPKDQFARVVSENQLAWASVAGVVIRSLSDLPASYAQLIAAKVSHLALNGVVTYQLRNCRYGIDDFAPGVYCDATASVSPFVSIISSDEDLVDVDRSTLFGTQDNDPTTYAWVKVDDIKAIVEALGVKFGFERIVRPLDLEILNVGTSLTSPSFTKNQIDTTILAVQFSNNVGNTYALIGPSSQPSVQEGTIKTDSVQTLVRANYARFTSADSEANCDWVRDVSDTDALPLVYSIPQSDISPARLIFALGVSGSGSHPLSIDVFGGINNTHYDLTVQKFDSIGFQGNALYRLSLPAKLIETEFGTIARLAIQSWVSSGTNTNEGGILAPYGYFSRMASWADSSYNNFNAQLVAPNQYRPITFHPEAEMIATAVSVSPGFNLISPPGIGKWSLLCRARPFIDLS